MSIYEKVIETYPELKKGLEFRLGKIIIQDDSDGRGDFIAKWDYEKPIPAGLELGKPTA